ncbi:asparaginyl-tRNA synthetase, partial [Spiromyces aspiralis]
GGGETFFAATSGSRLSAAADRPATGDVRQDAVAGMERGFFGKRVNLTVSGQLHAEVIASAMPRVYTFGPVFRAEPSQTGRHLAEFWMLEVECAFIDKLSQLMDIIEASVKRATQYLQEVASEDLGLFNRWVFPGLDRRLMAITATRPYPRMTYTEAVEVLRRAQPREPFRYEPKWGVGLQSEHERYLATAYCKGPVFVTDYPKAVKPFYMLPNPDGRTVACMDLLVPGPCELAGGSMREHRLEMLQRSIEEFGMSAESLDWYLDLRRHGTVPHGGFGVGFERYIQMITGLESIRDVVPFPRYA